MNVRSSLVCALMGPVGTPSAVSDVSVAVALLWMLRKGTVQISTSAASHQTCVAMVPVSTRRAASSVSALKATRAAS